MALIQIIRNIAPGVGCVSSTLSLPLVIHSLTSVLLAMPVFVLFFFQAEDGIRDYKVTGVQTCALPIWEFRRDEQVAAVAADHELEQVVDELGGLISFHCRIPPGIARRCGAQVVLLFAGRPVRPAGARRPHIQLTHSLSMCAALRPGAR